MFCFSIDAGIVARGSFELCPAMYSTISRFPQPHTYFCPCNKVLKNNRVNLPFLHLARRINFSSNVLLKQALFSCIKISIKHIY